MQALEIHGKIKFLSVVTHSMINFIINLVANGLAVLATTYVLNYFFPGSVQLDSFTTALIVGVALGLVNATIKPVVSILALPLSIVSLGLFSFVISGLMVWLVSYVLPMVGIMGFALSGFLWAIVFALVLSIITFFINLFLP